MTEEQLISAFPELKKILDSRPELRESFNLILSHNLQGSMVRYLTGCSRSTLETFLEQVKKVDPIRIKKHRTALEKHTQQHLGINDVFPIKMVTLEEQAKRSERDYRTGIKSLRQGSIASVAFAGGSGTRFFSHLSSLKSLHGQTGTVQAENFSPDDPKGAFPISPVGGLSFFEIIIAEALSIGIETGHLPWVVFLTSSVTHQKTLSFLMNRNIWGFPKNGFLLIQQAQEPRLDEQGDLVIADTDGHLAWTGDGHGGVYRALLAKNARGSSALEILRSHGVKHLVMHNVDNAAARPFAPNRIGFHVAKDSLFTLSVTRKVNPDEKVGVLMQLVKSNRTEVVEYNVIDRELAHATDPTTGRLMHEAGNINTNIVSLDAVRSDIEPTLYRGKIVSSSIGKVSSSSLEMLNQHLTRLLPSDRVFALEVNRDEFFMPTKNVTGDDSVVTTREMMSRRFSRMLTLAGAHVDGRAICDLHPCCSNVKILEKIGVGPGWHLDAFSHVYFCAAMSTEKDAPVVDGNLYLERGSSLVVDCEKPWGELSMDSERRIIQDSNAASRLKIGPGFRITPGVHVKIKIGPGAKLKIGKGIEFTEDTQIELGPGHELEI